MSSLFQKCVTAPASFALRERGRAMTPDDELDLERIQLPPGEDFGIPSDYEIDEEDIELDSGFSTCIGEKRAS